MGAEALPDLNTDWIQERDRVANHFGIRKLSCAGGRAVASMVVDDRHLNGMDRVQGGATFSLADFAFALACNSRGPAVAANVSITFSASAKAGDTLTATAREISLSKRLGSYQVEVRDQAERLIASFQGLAYRMEGMPPSPKG